MGVQVAVVAYEGVLADESHALRDVLGRLPDARLLTVGQRRGIVAGPGGSQVIDATFDEVHGADIVAVPGGLGSHRHTEIGWWIPNVAPQWIVACSTGSALLAAAGLLRGRHATTHWLAGPLLERHGAVVTSARLTVDPPFITCTGRSGAYAAAFEVVRRVGDEALVAAIRADINARPAADITVPCPDPRRLRQRPPAAPRRGPLTVGDPVEVELELAPTPQRPTRR